MKQLVQAEAVADRGHRELAHAEVDVVGVRVVAGDRLAALPQGQVGMREVGRAADQFRQQRRERLDRHLRGLARGDDRAFGLQLGDVGVGGGDEAFRQLACERRVSSSASSGYARGVLVEQRVPLRLAHQAGVADAPAVVDLVGISNARVRPVQRVARGDDFVLAQRRAVAGLLAGLARASRSRSWCGSRSGSACRWTEHRGVDRAS